MNTAIERLQCHVNLRPACNLSIAAPFDSGCIFEVARKCRQKCTLMITLACLLPLASRETLTWIRATVFWTFKNNSYADSKYTFESRCNHA